MNERLTLQDLIDLLSEKQGITKKDAETFIREFVDLTTETIGEKDFVRIKDFGTFKLTAVKARKSVDVNTGVDIEIAAHYKLSFSPDKVLRELVNRPFAHFESIILEDEVSFEDKKEVKTKVVEKTPPPPVVVPPAKKEPEAVKVVEETLPIEAVKEELVEEEIELADISSLPLATEEIIDEIDVEPLVVSGMSEIAVEDVKPEPKPIQKYKHEEPEDDEYDDEEEDDDEDEDDDYEYLQQDKKKYNTWIGIGLVVVVILAVVYWGYGTYYSERTVDVPLAQNNPGITISDKEEVNATKDSDPKAGEGVTTTLTQPEEVKPVVSTPKEEQGREIEILQGESMRSLGTKYYGHRAFWVYIFEDNRDVIPSPNNIQAGMKVVLPPASKYGIDANDPESRKKAERLENKLFGEFEKKD